jgi:hypothetical protein
MNCPYDQNVFDASENRYIPETGGFDKRNLPSVQKTVEVTKNMINQMRYASGLSGIYSRNWRLR